MSDVKLQSAFHYQNATLEIPHFQIEVPNGTFFSGAINWQPLEFAFTGHINARQIQIGKLPCPELRFRFKANSSFTNIEHYEAQIAKHKHYGHLQIDVTEALPTYAWLNETKGTDLSEILFLFGFHNKLCGQLRLKTELKTRGVTLEELKHNLSGTADMVLNQGQIPGINLLALLSHTDTTFKKVQENLIKGQPSNLGAILTAELLEWRQQAISKDPLMTPFESLEANFTIGQGIIKNDLLKINHAKFQLTGQGALTLENSMLKFESHALLQPPTEASGTLLLQPNTGNQSSDQNSATFPASVPLSIMIQGPLDNVSIRPALEQYAKQILKLSEESQKADKEDKNPKALEKLFGFQ